MMLLYIIRHGETDYNVEGRLQGWSDIPLNEKGRKLAEVTGKALKDVPFDLVITSPLERAVETAKLVIGDRKVPFVVDRRIIECGNGEWEGLNKEEIEAKGFGEEYEKIRTDPMKYKGGPGGETIKQVLKRTAEFLDEILANPQYQDKTILISLHGGSMRAMLNRFYENKEDFWHGNVPPNCAVNIVKVENGNAVLWKEDQIYYGRSLISDHYNYADHK